jgi:glycosyltransferase involved in cell wall biosynthesis
MSNKVKVLAWSDSPVSGTGFGTVSKHVLGAIHATGTYEIHHLAINFKGDFVDPREVPWQMQPASVEDPKDLQGVKRFLKMISQTDYDIVWVLNDIYVTRSLVQPLATLKKRLAEQKRPWPIFIYYYPVDCKVQVDSGAFLDFCDINVCYTNHGRELTLQAYPHLTNLRQMPHGVDTKAFYPATSDEILRWRQDLFRIDPETTLVVNVNRNSTRKQIPYSMAAFKEFKKRHPKSRMYIHAATIDQGGDLSRAIEDLGMDIRTDIILPTNYSPAHPLKVSVLNQIYNCADLFLTTHLGEGWGLTISEAMAAGTPVVSPNNTCMPEHFGSNSERGYMYSCTDTCWIDNSGFRPKGNIPDIVEQMELAISQGPKSTNPKVQLARDWAMEHEWAKILPGWVEIFDRAQILKRDRSPQLLATPGISVEVL